jgi:hypothetical protein
VAKPRPQHAGNRPRAGLSLDFFQSRFFALIAFGIAAITLVILFSEFLFSDKMLYGSDMIKAGIFFRSFLVDHVKQFGAVPQWNPYIFGGLPFVEAFHGDIFYPFSVLKYAVSIERAYGYTFFLHLLAAGVFMYLCARQFKLHKVAAFIAGAAYMSAPYLVSFITPGHDGKIFVTTLFPLVILFLDRGFERRPLLNFSLLGLVIGLIILTPHPQMAYFTLWAVSFYATFKLITLFVEQKSIIPAIRPALLTVYAVVIGLMLSAIQFYPGYVYTSQFSPRAADDSKSGWNWATSWSMHEEEAMGLLIPEFAGANVEGGVSYYWGKNYFKDNSESVSVVALFLALLGFFLGRKKETWFFAALALFALLYGLGATTPFFHLFYLIPKVASLRAPSMIMFLFSFSVALLAGMAVNQIILRREEKLDRKAEAKSTAAENKVTYALIGFPALLLLLAFLFSVAGKSMIDLWTGLFYSGANLPIQPDNPLTKLDLAYRNLPAIQAGAWWAFLAVGASAGLVWLYRARRAGMAALFGVAVIILFTGVRFNSRFVHVVDPDQFFRYQPVHQFLDRQSDYYRSTILTSPQDEILPLFHNYVPYGYHGNQLRWYDQLAGGPQMSSAFNARFLSLTGTKWVLIPSNQRLPDNFLGTAPQPVVATFGNLSVVRNDNALPRVFLVDQYRIYADRAEIYPEVLKGTEDLRKIVYLEAEPPLDFRADTTDFDAASADSAWLLVYEPDTVKIGLRTTKSHLLVLTDNYFDAWQVTVDGQPAELLRAYGSFRAMAVPAGAKEVFMWYDSPRYARGKLFTILTGLWLIVILGFYGVTTVMSRRRETDITA